MNKTELATHIAPTFSPQAIDSPTSSSYTSFSPSPQLSNPQIAIRILDWTTLTEQSFRLIQKTLGAWEKICREKASTDEQSIQGTDTVQDTRNMCCTISLHLKERKDNPTESILLCLGPESSKIQGIAIVHRTQTFFILDDIVTNPENIRAPIYTTTAEKVRGVGTALIAEITRMCRSEGKVGIFLKALRGAIGFYTHCGFSSLDPSESGLSSMFLSTYTSRGTSLLGRAEASATPEIIEDVSAPEKPLTPRSASEDSSDTPAIIPLTDEHQFTLPSTLAVTTVVYPKPHTVRLIDNKSSQIERHSRPMIHHVLLRLGRNATPLEDLPQQQINRTATFLSRWKEECRSLLDNPDVGYLEKLCAKTLKKICTKATSQLQKFDPTCDVLLACVDTTTSQIQGMAHISKKNKILVVRHLVINPTQLSASNATTYARAMSRIGDALIAQIGKICAWAGSEGVLVKPLKQEEAFYHQHGFETVDDEEIGRIRMLVPATMLW